MQRNFSVILFFISLFLLSSCATLLNQKTTYVKVITSQPGQVLVENDTINTSSSEKFIWVPRQKAPLKITAVNDSISKTVFVRSRNSFAYWLNLYPNWTLGIGFLIDRKNPKRYTYPKTIFIDMSKNDSSYLSYKPITHTPKQKNIIKFTPLKTLDFANPSIEISYERVNSNYFSTQLSASYLLPSVLIQLANDFPIHTKGFKVGIEEKFYFRKSAPAGTYMSLEFNYLQTCYNNTSQFETTTASMYISYTDYYKINKTLYNINLKWGYQLFIKRFVLDIYGGLGIRYKDVTHSNRTNMSDKMELSRHPNAFYITNKPGSEWTIALPVNIKLGYTF